jgi:hypothetical protein
MMLEKIHYNLKGLAACGTQRRNVFTNAEATVTCANCKKWIERRQTETKVYGKNLWYEVAK